MSRNGEPANDYDENENLAFLPADHPLMARLQAALKKTLEHEHEKTHLKLKEKESKFKQIERNREDTAVQLYEVQQNLAEMHLTLEQTHQNYNLIQKLRIEAEQKFVILDQEHKAKSTEIDILERNIIKAQDELSKLSRIMKQVEAHNEQMKSEVAVTKKTVHVKEETMAATEHGKRKQDFLIDHLTEQKKKLNEQIVIIEAQLLAQKDETKAARDILKEAYNEMENITASKKNLLDRWQKSLLEMQRRDKALQVARDALKVQYEINVQISTELAGINNEIKKEAEISETLAGSLNRLKHEERHLEEEKKKLDHDQSKLNAQIKILQQSLQSTESSAQVVDRDNTKIQSQMNVIEDNIMKIHTQAKDLLESVIHKISEHKTLEKKSANLLKQAQVVQQETEEKQIEKEGVENEIARVNIDTLNTTNQLDALKQKKREVSEERKKKEETVATYDLEIRQGHDINEKKQKEVGKLNKVHDEIMSSASEMSRGPMDAHKNHLVNKIKEVTEDAQQLERGWIKKQTALVKQQTTLNKVSEETSDLKTRKTILEQKKMRLHTIYDGHEKEIREIKNGLKFLQTEMNKLNDGLAKNANSKEKYENENYHIQSEFVEKLKELEKGNVKLESQIDNIKEEKAELLQSIVEAERQLLLWERKIQLEREIQDALDPEIGQSEIKLLQKDIHRMELRLDELRKRQEQAIQEMERAVYKRETIMMKYQKNDDPTEKKRPATTNATQTTRQIQTLKSSLDQATRNNRELDKKLGALQTEIMKRNTAIAQLKESSEDLENELGDKMATLVRRRIEREAGVFEIVELQTRYKGFDSLANNKFKLEATENQLRQRYEKQQDTNRQMIEVLKEISEANPQYAEVISALTTI